jgi:hypothetical protein
VVEIRIQRKRRRKVWPWLLGALVLALLPLPFFDDRDEAPAPRAANATRDSIVASNAPAARGTAGAVDTAQRRDTINRVTATAAGAVAPASPAPAAAVGPSPDSASPTVAATSFERFIASNAPRSNARAQRQYTADGLHRLADELRTLGASDAGVRAIRLNADSLRMTGDRGDRRSDHVRAAFVAAVRELDVLRERHAAKVDTGRLRSAAWAIGTDQRLLAQRGRVQRFFESARDALQSLPRRQ